jgi:hypothetical protein
MAIHLLRSIVSHETRPRCIDELNAAPTVAADLDFPVAKRGACILKESSRSVEVGGVLKLCGRIVRCSTKFAINDVATIIGRKFERKYITLVRPGDGGRLANTKGQQRQKQ